MSKEPESPQEPEVRDVSFNQAFFANKRAKFTEITLTLKERGLQNFEEYVDKYRRWPTVSGVTTAKFGKLAVYRFDTIADRPWFVVVKRNRLVLPDDCENYRVLERIDQATFELEYQIFDDHPDRVLTEEKETELVKAVAAEYLIQPVDYAHQGRVIRFKKEVKPN